MSRKPRADSRLKTLPDERQRSIIDLLKTKTISDVRKELRADGIETSSAALSEFYSWWQLAESFRQTEHTTETLLEQLKQEVPEITDSQLDELGQRTFSLLAIQSQDQDAFMQVRTARFKAELEREKLALRRQAEERQAERLRFERDRWIEESCQKILQAATDVRTREIAASSVSNSEKIAALRATWFADVDALESKVQLPE